MALINEYQKAWTRPITAEEWERIFPAQATENKGHEAEDPGRPKPTAPIAGE